MSSAVGESVDQGQGSSALEDAKNTSVNFKEDAANETVEEMETSEEVNPKDGANNKNNSGRESSSNFELDWNDSEPHATSGRNPFLELMDMINQFRYNCGMLVNNNHVQGIIVAMISINGIMMGIGTYDFVRENTELHDAFEIVDKVFLIIFTVELSLQFIYHGWRLILDGWLVFDLVIIITSWTFSAVQIIRAFRIFRALRLVTRIKVMKNLILGTYPSRIKGPRNSISLNCLSNIIFNSSVWCGPSNGGNWADVGFDLLHFCGHVHAALQRSSRSRGTDRIQLFW